MTTTVEPRPDLEEIRARLLPLLPEMRRRGVTAVYVFGSVARGTAGPDSDLDLFVDYDPEFRFSLFDLMRFSERMSEASGRKVDLHTRGGLHPVIRSRIEAQAERLL